MSKTPWQQRIRRAEKLAAQQHFSAEMLGFYIHVAHFQQDMYGRLEHASKSRVDVLPDVESATSRLSGQLDAAAVKTLAASFPQFLALVEERAPTRLSQTALDLLGSDPNSWADLFVQCWTRIDAPTDPREFLVLAFLQPYAEYVRAQSRLQLEGYSQSMCPFCNRKPALGVLRQQGDGARRSLVCGFCLAEWEFRRVVCPGCGQEDHAKLPVYTAEMLPHIRVECCDTCKTYIKSIDLTKNGLADPLVDELASVPLNIWAEEHGYAKLRPNLFGM